MNMAFENQLKWKFAQKRPVQTFLLINFAWTWAFWFAAIPLAAGNELLRTAIVIIGGFGPALGAILTLGLRDGIGLEFSLRRMLGALFVAGLLFRLLALRYQFGNIPNFDILAENLDLTLGTLLMVGFATLVGGWVYSSVISKHSSVQERMVMMLPTGVSFIRLVVSMLFYPVLILLAWGLAAVLGLGIEFPGLWGHQVSNVLPLYVLTFMITALMQGGNEEPGWRGFMQPELQKRFSPLVAALFVSVFWSLWHLPLYLNGFYGDPLVGGMIGGSIYRVLLSIFLAWLYQHSNGSLFLMIFLHASFNVMVNFLPTSDIGLLILWLLVVIGVVFQGKMWRKPDSQHKLIFRDL